ncbi:MAG: hypothetical protein ACKVVT_15375 [Dehalococcoidia bacterium]
MPAIEVPVFLDAPSPVYVRCEASNEMDFAEVACSIRRPDGQERVIIVPGEYFDRGKNALRGFLVADVNDGKLVDFPSGDRVMVPLGSILSANGRPL